jgi:hypothetical protein
MNFDYKKYSLENLENWMHDAMSAGEATPQEIYDTIRKVVEENYYAYKQKTSEAYELLALLNGNGIGHVKEYDDCVDKILSCDKDDPSPECKGAWNDFWEDSMPPWGHSDLEYSLREAEYYNKQPDLKKEIEEIKKEGGYDWTPVGPKDGYPLYVSEDGDVWIPDYVTKKDKVVKWQLPVQQKIEEGIDDYYIQFPDDLLEAANLKEGDTVEWVDNNNGTYTLRKVDKT